MLINELSKRTGIAIATIRYYENMGLVWGNTVPDVKTNNYKRYNEEMVERLGIIIDAKELGFTLSEIKELLHVWHSDSSSREEKAEIFRTKISAIDDKIRQFKKVKKRLEQFVVELEKGECEAGNHT